MTTRLIIDVKRQDILMQIIVFLNNSGYIKADDVVIKQVNELGENQSKLS